MCYITRNGYEELYRSFLNVDNEILETNNKKGESVKLDNDLRQNPEFMQLRVKAMYELPKKKEKLLKKYKDAIIIEDMDSYKKFDGQTVIIGSIVEIDFGGEKCTYTILGTDEGNLEEGVLSCDAPIAKALIGKHVGDTVIFNDVMILILTIEKYAWQ